MPEEISTLTTVEYSLSEGFFQEDAGRDRLDVLLGGYEIGNTVFEALYFKRLAKIHASAGLEKADSLLVYYIAAYKYYPVGQFGFAFLQYLDSSQNIFITSIAPSKACLNLKQND